MDPIAFELVKKRLQRSDKDFNRRFVVTLERVKFHDLHRFLAITLDDRRLRRCGTACPPGSDDPDDPLSKGNILIEPPTLQQVWGTSKHREDKKFARQPEIHPLSRFEPRSAMRNPPAREPT
jgi:hypothetical protein